MPRSKFVEGNSGFCPQCKAVPVTRKTNIGTMPRCSGCLQKAKDGRNKRAAQARENGERLSHYDIEGIRYEKKSKKYTCTCCNTAIDPKVNIMGMINPVCDKKDCRDMNEKLVIERKKRRKKEETADKPKYNRNRLRLKLEKVGLDLEWFDYQVSLGCGICGTKTPSKKGWAIDHSHTCCKSGKFCTNCIRGILCGPCNMGLGQFKDDPIRLRKAAEWVSGIIGAAHSRSALPAPTGARAADACAEELRTNDLLTA